MKLRKYLEAARDWLRGPQFQSQVWVFNNMPAGARVNTKVSCPLPRRQRRG